MQLVVTTWNLQGSAGMDQAAVAAHLRDQGSDLVLLQEVQRDQARRLAALLAVRSLDWRFKHWPVRIPAEGMAVLGVTRPVERIGAWALTARWQLWSWRRRIVQVARLDRLTLANVHLTPHADAPAQDLRQREMAEVVRRLRLPSPAVAPGRGAPEPDPRWLVAGDLNAPPGAALTGQLRAAGLSDAWASLHPGDGPSGATNWSSRRRTGPPDRRIDYVWVSDGSEVRAARLPAAGDPGFELFPRLSDHLPLTVALDL